MRLIELDARSFGPLKDRKLDLDAGIVIVSGPNEAGKSSFALALETILYGFKPADPERHPLVHWLAAHPAPLHLTANLRFSGGDVQRVERVLQKKATSRTAAEDREFSGPRRGNVELSSVHGLSREVYRSLYALELEQLRELDGRVRADVDELLLPLAPDLPIRPLAEVREELRRQHLELWRPDNRGKPLAKALRARLSEARAIASEAAERERDLREARSERADLEGRLEDLHERRRVLLREHEDAPLLGELFELSRRRGALGVRVDLSALGDRPLTKPSQLGAELDELEDRLREPESRLRQPILELSAHAAALLAEQREIEALQRERPRRAADAEREREQRSRAESLRERARGQLERALDGSAEDDALATAARVALDALAELQRLSLEHAELRATRARRFANVARAVAVLLGTAGLAATVAGGAGLLQLELARVGAGVAFAALLTALFVRPRQRSEAIAAETVATHLEGLAIAEPLASTATGLQRLIEILEGVQQLLAESRTAARAANELRGEGEQDHREARRLAEDLGIECEGSADTIVRRLVERLRDAMDEQERVETDRRARQQATQLCERDRPLLARRLEHRQLLESALSAAAPQAATLDAAFDQVRERLSEEDFLERREAELRKDPRSAAFAKDPRIRGDRPPAPDAPWLAGPTSARELALRSQDEEIETTQRRLGELSETMAADPGSSLARATDAVVAITEQLRETERERDRLALLDAIASRAERDFRDAHQPDVLRRASQHLARVTLGRYGRLDVGDGPDAPLLVTPRGAADPVPVGRPISRGTLDQIHLCLRLGLLDHLDAERERLPLVLDDALLRMDDQRRLEVYALLAEIAVERQVFLLTCHANLADEAAKALASSTSTKSIQLERIEPKRD